jgi:hypothetical protein
MRRLEMKGAAEVSLMRAAKPIFIAVVLVSMTTFSGCIGLVVSRELMEQVRGVPETEDAVLVYSFDHVFDSTDPEDIIFHPEPHQIRIDSEVKEIQVFFRVQMDFSEIAGFETGNLTSTVRYVHAMLWEPGANKNTDTPYWEENATTDRYPPLQRFSPPFELGVWELEVDAQGYGLDTPIDQISFHDEFEVSVSVIRPCIEFPERADPDECIPV